jgi:hypothetical protein
VTPLISSLALLAAPRGPPDGGPHQLWEWIEAHSSIVYPALAVLIIGLIVGALLASWKSDELNAESRGKLKMEILALIRRRVSGVSAETVAAAVQIDLMLAARLLAELDEEGLVSASGRAPIQYRIRGVR